MELNLENKVAVITGGAQGIGKAIALELAREGANIVIADICSEAAEHTINEVKSINEGAIAVIADVRIREDAERMVKRSIENFSRLDILINNAGLTRLAPITATTEEDWDLVIDTNLKGTFLCCQSAAKVMIAQRGGCIINISSMCGIQGWAEREPYGAAKAGVNNLTRILAAELGEYDIRVNCVAPGYVLTKQLEELIDDGKINYATLLKGVPIGRLAAPEDIANAVIFLASDKAQLITGEVFVVDGGWTSAGGSWQIPPSKLRKK